MDIPIANASVTGRSQESLGALSEDPRPRAVSIVLAAHERKNDSLAVLIGSEWKERHG